ncbi:hypothetical protein CEXT_356071 [Caerostris extrusa]|uniref:Uncharacterized protein n=1 Tax=Caerostris extrusa TaxID=172846 RepID=A0AAV4SP55_CAEEX|nr:hypothetical protein CEXT_356071 [Caerostris extrusa]
MLGGVWNPKCLAFGKSGCPGGTNRYLHIRQLRPHDSYPVAARWQPQSKVWVQQIARAGMQESLLTADRESTSGFTKSRGNVCPKPNSLSWCTCKRHFGHC